MTFRATGPTGQLTNDLTPETLRPLLDGAEEFVIVENTDWGDQHYAQATVNPDRSWQVTIRSGGSDKHIATSAPNTDATFDILRSWAAADGWWQNAFSWEPVRL